MSEIDWKLPIQFASGDPAFLYAEVFASGKSIFSDGTTAHSDVAGELHSQGVRYLVCRTPGFDDDPSGFRENGNAVKVYGDDFYDKRTSTSEEEIIQVPFGFQAGEIAKQESMVSSDVWGIF